MNTQNFKNTALIAGFRVFSGVFGFIIPLYLSRHISIEDYGTYKALMLLQSTSMFILPLGIDSALLYYLQKDKKAHHIYSLNIIGLTLITGLCFVSIFLLANQQISGLLNIEEIGNLKESFSLFLMTSLMTNHIYIYFIFKEKIKTAICIELISQVSKTFLIVFGFYAFNRLDKVFWLLGIFFGLELIAILTYHFIGLSKSAEKDHGRRFIDQMRHGLPVGLSNLALYISDLDKLIISALFGAKSFAIYSSGCFKLPFTNSIDSTLLDMMGMSMVKAYESNKIEQIKKLWRNCSRQILSIQIPIGVFFCIFSKAAITLIFSKRYIESAAVFSIFILTQSLNCSQPDMLFRAMNETKKLMQLQTIYVVSSFIAVAVGAYTHGPLGAIIGKFLVNAGVLILKISWFKKRLNIPLNELYDWRPIMQILSISVCGALIADALSTIWAKDSFTKISIGGLTYLCFIYLTAFRMNGLRSTDKDFLEALLAKQYQKIKSNVLVRIKT